MSDDFFLGPMTEKKEEALPVTPQGHPNEQTKLDAPSQTQSDMSIREAHNPKIRVPKKSSDDARRDRARLEMAGLSGGTAVDN